MKINNETLTESVAELMDDADALLNLAGISIDEAVEDPQEFIETLAEILDENDLEEDVEELLCLNIALIESFMLNKDVQLEDIEDDDNEPDVTEASMTAKLHKAMRRRIEKAFPLATHWKHAKGDELAGKEPDAMLRRYLDKKSKVLPMKEPSAPPEKKHAVGEEAEDVDALVNKVVEAVEEAGYEVPGDLPVEDFLDSAEALAATDKTVAEGLGSKLGGLAIKALKSKTAAWAAKKLARAGTKALVRKMSGPPTMPVPEEVEDTDSLLTTMIEVLTNNGYAFEGSEENFDPESFVEAASEIAQTDEDLAEDLRTWLAKASTAVKTEMRVAAVNSILETKGLSIDAEDMEGYLAGVTDVLENHEFSEEERAALQEFFSELATGAAKGVQAVAQGVKNAVAPSKPAGEEEDEAGETGKLPKGKWRSNAGPGMRKFVKKSTSRKMRRMSKQDPEGAPTKAPVAGHAD